MFVYRFRYERAFLTLEEVQRMRRPNKLIYLISIMFLFLFNYKYIYIYVSYDLELEAGNVLGIYVYIIIMFQTNLATWPLGNTSITGRVRACFITAYYNKKRYITSINNRHWFYDILTCQLRVHRRTITCEPAKWEYNSLISVDRRQ